MRADDLQGKGNLVQTNLRKLLIDTHRSERGASITSMLAKCPRRYAYFNSGIEKSTFIPYLERGNLLHIALAHHYAHAGIRLRGKIRIDGSDYTDKNTLYSADRALQIAAKRLLTKFPEEGDSISKSVIQVMEIMELVQTTEPAIKMMVPVAVESVFRTRFKKGGLIHTDRIDLLGEDHMGRLVAVDHKGTSRTDKEFWITYRKSMQFIQIYRIMQKKFGAAFSGVQILACKYAGSRSKARVILDDANPFPGDLQPERVERTLTWWDKIEKELWLDFGDLDAGEWPAANNADVCRGAWGFCPFFDVCGREI